MSSPDDIELARGLTRCAADCFQSLQCLIQERSSSLSVGILAGHCAEAALKAHLAHAGWKEKKLKALGHDLLKCWSSAHSVGTNIAPDPPKWIIGIGYSHNGLRYRYPNSWQEPWLPHPEEYMDELSDILEPLLADFMRVGGRYVREWW